MKIRASSKTNTLEKENDTNCNEDKIRINQLKEALQKILSRPEMTKKAAKLIEELLRSDEKKNFFKKAS